MVFSKALALAAIFATLTSAAPMQQKRAVVYETVTEVDVTTIDTTITIYPGEATPTSAVVAAVTTTAVAVTSVPEKVAVSSSTSTYIPAPAPQTSSSTTEQAPAPTSTYTPPPPAPTTTSTTSSSSSSTSTTSTSSAPPASTSTGSSILSGSGDGTYYETATSMSAPSYCDTANDGDTTNVVALSYEVMDESLCGATITVEYNGVTSTGTVVDKCMGCDSGSVDMSEHMFEELADLGAGRISVTWSVV